MELFDSRHARFPSSVHFNFQLKNLIYFIANNFL